jgi:hypothetical protein
MGIGDQAFGEIRTDGSLKPAGAHLESAYCRCRENPRARW